MASGVSSRSDKSGEFDFDHFLGYLNVTFPLNFTKDELTDGIEGGKLVDAEQLTIQVVNKIEQAYADRNAELDDEQRDYLERHTILEAIDRLWQEHLYAMDGLRSSIYLRVYAAQKDPLVEYKHEAYGLFKRLMDQVYHDVAHNLFRLTLARAASIEEMLANMPQEQVHQLLEQFGGRLPEEEAAQQMFEEDDEPAEVPGITFHREAPKVGRNDLCPCGSGKKFKKCCGK